MDLWIRLAGWHKEKLADARRAEDAYAKALAIDAENLDVLRAVEEIRRAPGRERELVQTLRTWRPSGTSCARPRRWPSTPSTTASSPSRRCATSSPRTRATFGRSRS
jgi:hypothetical protein